MMYRYVLVNMRIMLLEVEQGSPKDVTSRQQCVMMYLPLSVKLVQHEDHAVGSRTGQPQGCDTQAAVCNDVIPLVCKAGST
jgi:hypothetical protein